MTTDDDSGQSDPQDRKPELDAYGLPVQDQPAKDRIILGAVSWLMTIAIATLGGRKE